MALTSLGPFGIAPPIQHEDKYKVNIETGAGVVFLNDARKICVQGVLSQPLSVSSTAQWSSFLGSMGSVVSMADTVLQAFASTTIQQPWMGRCAYQGTDPMKLSITVDFSTSVGNPLGVGGTHDAYQEVYVPALELLGFTVPRAGAGDQNILTAGAGKITDGVNGILKKISENTDLNADAFQVHEYVLPGPSITMGGGDITSITIGNILLLQQCYITNVSLAIDNVFSPDGYPTHIQAKVDVQCCDKPYMTGLKFHKSNAVGWQSAPERTVPTNFGITSSPLASLTKLAKAVPTAGSLGGGTDGTFGKTAIGSSPVVCSGWTPEGSTPSVDSQISFGGDWGSMVL